MISSYPQSYVQQSAGGRSFPPSLTGLAGGGNPNASPGPGDLYADGSLPGYTAAAVAAAAAAAAAAGSPQTGSIAALARVRKYFTRFFKRKELGEETFFFIIIICFLFRRTLNGSMRETTREGGPQLNRSCLISKRGAQHISG